MMEESISNEVGGRVRKQRADDRWQDQLTCELKRGGEVLQKKAEAATEGNHSRAADMLRREMKARLEGDSLRRDGPDSEELRTGVQAQIEEDMLCSADLESPPSPPPAPRNSCCHACTASE